MISHKEKHMLQFYIAIILALMLIGACAGAYASPIGIAIGALTGALIGGLAVCAFVITVKVRSYLQQQFSREKTV